MASNYDNYSHIELIRELHLRDRRIDLLKQELQLVMPTAQSIENSGDNQKVHPRNVDFSQREPVFR